MLTERIDDVGSMSTAYAFFTGIGVLVTGIALGFVTVAVCVYKGSSKEGEEELPYEQKYYDEFHDMETRALSESEVSGLVTCFLRETTPSGDVIMSYCGETETYQYWCDDKNIKFMTLDAVAQKYAIDNDVKAICVDYKDEYEAGVEAVKQAREKRDAEQAEEPGKVEDEAAPSVFAKFKKYNTASEKTKPDARKSRISVLTEKCNRFKRRGVVSDWEMDHKVEEEASAAVAREPELSVTEWLRQRRAAVSASPEPSN